MSAAEVRIPLPANVTGEEVRVLAGVKLFELGRVSLGQAAALADQSVRSFVEVLAHDQVPVIDHPAEELDKEIES
jgi:predicted HTH domain antitoxin